MPRFPQDVESVLRGAGWVPDRRVDLAPWTASLAEFTWHAAAEEFLREFGGIRVDISGPGVTCMRQPFDFDPELALGEEERFAELSQLFGRSFFPVGEVGQGEFFLAIDETVIVYFLGTAVFLLGVEDVALVRLIFGIAPERLGTPGESTL